MNKVVEFILGKKKPMSIKQVQESLCATERYYELLYIITISASGVITDNDLVWQLTICKRLVHCKWNEMGLLNPDTEVLKLAHLISQPGQAQTQGKSQLLYFSWQVIISYDVLT